MDEVAPIRIAGVQMAPTMLVQSLGFTPFDDVIAQFFGDAYRFDFEYTKGGDRIRKSMLF